MLIFLNREQLSYARFAEIIGVQPSSISHILSGRNKPGFDFIEKFLRHYPMVNADWLIMGKGNMLKQSNIQGSLFQGTENPSKKDDRVHEQPDVPQDNPVQTDERTSGNTNVNSAEHESDHISKFTSDSGITYVNSGRTVEKIVIFYSDKSFSEYSPEKSR